MRAPAGKGRQPVTLAQVIAVTCAPTAWVLDNLTLISGDYRTILLVALALAFLAFGGAGYEIVVRRGIAVRILMLMCMAIATLVIIDAISRL